MVAAQGDVKSSQARHLVGLLIAFLAVFTAPLMVAFNLGAIVSKFSASGTTAGMIFTVEGVSVSLATLACTHLLSRHPARVLIGAGLLMVVAGNALSVVATDTNMLTVFRAIAGAGTGIVICVVMATAARTSKPEMTYGWINGSIGAYLSILALIVPQVISRGGFEAAYGLYAALAALAAFSLFLIPNTRAPTASSVAPAGSEVGSLRSAGLAGWISLIGFGVFFFAQAGLGAFLARFGARSDISLQAMGQVFFVGGLLTIVGPLAAGMVGARFGSTRPLVLVGSLMCRVTLGLALGAGPASFFVNVPMFMVLPALMLPSFLGGLAVVDPTGRLGGAQPAFATMGAALGPTASGMVADAAGLQALGWFSVAIFAVGLGLMAVSTLRADRLRGRNSGALA